MRSEWQESTRRHLEGYDTETNLIAERVVVVLFEEKLKAAPLTLGVTEIQKCR